MKKSILAVPICPILDGNNTSRETLFKDVAKCRYDDISRKQNKSKRAFESCPREEDADSKN